MARPSTPVFGANALVPSSKLSAVADVADYGVDPPVCIAARVAVLSLTTATLTNIPFDTEIADTLNMFAPTSTAITIQDAGIYLVLGWCHIASNSTGMRSLELYQNGAPVIDESGNAPSTFDARFSLSQLFVCSPGDSFGLVVYQNSGGNLNLTGARLSAVRVSGT